MSCRRKVLSIIVLSLAGLLGLAPVVAASPALSEACQHNPEAAICKEPDRNLSSVVISGINLVLYLIGIVAVIVIIYAGFQYVASAGDSGKVAAAKSTIVYAVIGLIVAMSAWAVVNLVVNNFG